MKANGGIGLLMTAIIADFFDVHAASALAAQAKPLVKIVGGYGSTDGGATILWFAKETKLFEKRGLDVVLVGMGAGSVSLRALISSKISGKDS